MIASWLALPLITIAVCAGLGLGVERLGRRALPGALVPLLGAATLAVLCDALTRFEATAAATPVVVAVLAAAGLAIGLARPGTRERLGRAGPAALAAIGAFACWAAPVVLSGEATFSGYITLDDTATWLAIGDGLLEHGRSFGTLAPSSFEATLAHTVGSGYPVGALVPFAALAKLAGIDAAWAVNPFLAVVAGLLAAASETLLRPLVRRTALRVGIAVLAAQPALLLGFGLWGGVKEVFAAALIAGLALALRPRRRPWLALAVIALALVSALSLGGGIWLLPFAAALILGARAGAGRGLGRSALLGVLAVGAVLAVAAFAGARLIPKGSFGLLDGEVLGNLRDSLSPAQILGVWPSGDPRDAPELAPLAYAAMAVVAVGWALAVRRIAGLRELPLAAWGVGVPLLGLAVYAGGSAWLGAKALTIATPAVLALGLAGLTALAERPGLRRTAAVTGLAAVAAGVLASSALTFSHLNLAPRERFDELARVGAMLDGRGPVLLTEYEPYATRHFLRDADPESPAELPRRRIPLRDGTLATPGPPVDTDNVRLADLLLYPVIVRRVSPLLSRPPGPYRLTWRGRFYEIWERPIMAAGIRTVPAEIPLHLPLEGRLRPFGFAACERLDGLFPRRDGAALLAAPSRKLVISSFAGEGAEGAVALPRGDSVAAEVEVPARGVWEIWLGSGTATKLELRLDGVLVGSLEAGASNPGQQTLAASRDLSAGPHDFEVRNATSPLAPGGARPAVVGPLVLRAAADPAAEPAPVQRRRACRAGRPYDWIESDPPQGGVG